MAEFYILPRSFSYLITLVIAIAVLSQVTAVILSYYRHPRNRKWAFETLLELFVLVQIYVCALLHGQAINGYAESIFAPTDYGTERIAVFSMIIVLSVIVMVIKRKPWPVLTILAATLTLPLAEQLAGTAFAYLYITAMFFWPARSLPIGLARYKEIRTSLSALSINNAIDTLHTGVMFCENDGFNLLSNKQMHQLMLDITGKVQRNGRKFYDLVSSGQIKPECKKTELEGQSVVLLPDGSTWMFTKTPLNIKTKEYTQITATNITERWKLTTELQQQNEELTHKGEELTVMIDNLHILSSEQETQKIKMRAHNILGEKLTLLLSTIQSEQAPDYDLLHSLAQGLMDELKTDKSAPVPQDDLDSLRCVFERIGVKIMLSGELPEDSAKGQLFVDVIREGTANAVRHGLATEVAAKIDLTDKTYRLTITDNGHLMSDKFAEGGGISGIRKKLTPFGGLLNVTSKPDFVLSITLPGGENGV